MVLQLGCASFLFYYYFFKSFLLLLLFKVIFILTRGLELSSGMPSRQSPSWWELVQNHYHNPPYAIWTSAIKEEDVLISEDDIFRFGLARRLTSMSFGISWKGGQYNVIKCMLLDITWNHRHVQVIYLRRYAFSKAHVEPGTNTKGLGAWGGGHTG